MRRSAPLLFSLLASLILFAPAAHAQAVSAADREAARDLFKDGYDLQKAGRYAEALERFHRSQQVYPAPTALLHVAECQAQLGQLIEAAETYRALGRQALPPDAPPAFVAAQTQGAAELQQVEPRIPKIRVDVTPPNAANLVVSIDGQPMNSALLDVPRPVNPGQHKVAATASGYDRIEAVVTVAEKEPTKTVALALKATAGAVVVAPVVVGPVIGPTLAPPPTAIGVNGQPPPPPVSFFAPGPPPPGPVGPGYVVDPAAPHPTGSRTGLFTGLRLGAIVPEGDSNLTNAIGPGFSLGAEFNFRFARRLYIGAVIDHGFLGAGGANSMLQAEGISASASASTTNFDAVFGVITSPDHFAALFQVGVGYRTVSTSLTGPSGGTLSDSLTSGEVMLGTGLWIPVGHSLRIVPRVDATFGSLSDSNNPNANSLTYAMLTLAVGGYYNLDFH